MAKLTFKETREKGLLLYEYIRGSWCHGIAVPGISDVDTGGVFMCPPEQLYGLGIDYTEQIADAKSDNVWYELNKFLSLVLKSNPTMLEALFIDDEFVIYEHPFMKMIKEHRDKFITKQCFNPFFGYAKSQISQATGYNKKCHYPENMKRRGILDFCFVAGDNEDTIPLEKWLEDRHLLQKYVGLSKRTNMPGCYSMFYDFGSHSKYEHEMRGESFDEKRYPINLGYAGIVNPDGESFDVRLSSIPKGQMAIGTMYYNQQAYEAHCREYKDWLEWKKNRNEVRYDANKKYSYDAKNMCECFRMINMAIEIARGEGVKVNRKNIDAEFLLDVKHHKYEYDELMEMLKVKEAEMNDAIANSTIPEKIDINFVNELLLNIRKTQIYGENI